MNRATCTTIAMAMLVGACDRGPTSTEAQPPAEAPVASTTEAPEPGKEADAQVVAGKPGPVPVAVVAEDGRYYLTRGGEPYTVHGAGIEFGDIAAFAAHGGTSFRTWRTDNGRDTGQEVLDRALEHGLTVLMCIEIGRERHGFDYDDEAAVAAQLEYARSEVRKYRDHPALLAWMIGNEPNLFHTNPKVFNAINDISKMIHDQDPHHPTTSAMAGFDAKLAELLDTRSPDLDFVSIQMYGDIVNLPQYIKEIGYTKPYMVTEWGAIGHWEVAKTAWDAPIEQNSTDKAANYLKSWNVAIEPYQDQILGAYVFLWGHKQERTPTWYGMFLADGTETETIDVMHRIWTGEWPDNRTPQVQALTLDGQVATDSVTLSSGQRYAAAVQASDPEDGPLRYQWVVMEESQATQEGGDKEAIPPQVDVGIMGTDASEVTLQAPAQPGAYRLFVYVYDDAGKAAHANLPFLVGE